MKKELVIIGAGMSGITLANQLAQGDIFNITLIELGGERLSFQTDIKFSAKSFGDYPTFCNGIGGTTLLWHGGIMPMGATELQKDKVFQTFYFNGLVPSSTSMMKSLGIRDYLSRFNGNVERQLNESVSLVNIAVPARRVQKFNPDKNIKVHLHCKIVSFVAEQDRISRLVLSDSNGVYFEVTVDKLIVCAGGLGSPSVCKRVLSAIGIDNKNIGRNLTDHPMGFIDNIKLRRDQIQMLFERSRIGTYRLRKGLAVFDQQSNLNHVFYFRPTFSEITDERLSAKKFMLSRYRSRRNYLKLFIALFDLDIVYEAVFTRIGVLLPTRNFSILVVSEQYPVNQNSVIDVDGKLEINWQVSSEELRSIARAYEKLRSFLGVEPKRIGIADIEKKLHSAAHHSGTCRMGVDVASTVVNENFLLRGTKNVYVCDGSIIPVTGYSNTGFTIMSLAYHLAKVLNRE